MLVLVRFAFGLFLVVFGVVRLCVCVFFFMFFVVVLAVFYGVFYLVLVVFHWFVIGFDGVFF